ncbi:MAG: phosphate signaling complex protein PhoU [Acidobacteriia bacterium]|nr:phosphate signaling complex protein PhoU [Terriglobia bacterium]MBV8902600.1 phosphate signaling complex protein PhoU [Terriglobia bacterium]MBV9742319.1 phosphate signaling complex protein PhoU [Terriglobia bacterium]
MGGLVESAIHRAVRSLIEQNRELAEDVIRDEPRVNRMEMEIDGLATRLLALRQPVARDLRLLTSALKINTDLERIGDLAMHIAERSLSLMNHPLVKPMTDIPKMASLVQSMLLKCLDAFVNSDADLAHNVLLSDDEVDELRDAVHAELLDIMQRDPTVLTAAIDLLFIARNLERIGDHATNIAEDVVFLVKGIDVRHHAQQVENA